ncbi:MAG: hypothetical protein QXK37_06055 [Candidatus Woesearchaeota archaeon]
MRRRGQVTLFIIFGVLLLFSALIIIYINSKVKPIQTSEKKQDEVQNYVEGCLKQVAEEGIIKAGLQGGYIDAALAREISSGFTHNSLFIPYWFYQRPMGIDSSEMPTLFKKSDRDNSIQDQLERYTTEKLNECLREFAAIKERGIEVNEKGMPKTKVSFTDSKVIVKLDYPIEIVKEDSVESRMEFSAEVPVRLKKIYELAKEIKDYETKTFFLERTTKNLISIYSRIDSQYLPPMEGGLDFAPCEKRTYWIASDVEQNFRRMLSSNIPYLKIANTDHSKIIVTSKEEPNQKRREIRQGVYDRFVHKTSEKNYRFMEVMFSFEPTYPLELDLGSQGILEPKSFEVDLLLAQLCMFQYKFSYNTRFPVLVTIIDKQSKAENKDYLFQFPLEVVIKDNFPRVRLSDVSGQQRKSDISYQCDINQRLSGPVTLNVFDEQGNGIDGALVYFQCGPEFVYVFDENGTVIEAERFAEKCFIGKTDKGVLDTKLPPCIGGGLLTIKRVGYVEKGDVIGTVEEGQSFTKNYKLDRIKELKLSIKKYFVMPPLPDSEVTNNNTKQGIIIKDGAVVACNADTEPIELSDNEDVILSIRKADLNSGALNVLGYYNKNNESRISLAPGEYIVDLQLIRRERFEGEMTFKKESQEKRIETAISQETIKYPDKDVALPVTFTGGAHYNITFTKEQLKNAKEITLFVFDEGPPRTLEEITQPLMHIEACSNLNRALISPELK